MGKISLSDVRSEFWMFRYGYLLDRLSDKAFFQFYKVLIISAVLTLGIHPFSKSQISNELAFDSIVVGYLKSNSNKIGQLSGFLTSGIREESKGLFTGNDSIVINPPTVSYYRLDDGKFARDVEVEITLDALKGEIQNLIYEDTLKRADLRKVRKTKHASLKGEHPGTFRKYILPAVSLSAGVAAIASLFYIRSR